MPGDASSGSRVFMIPSHEVPDRILPAPLLVTMPLWLVTLHLYKTLKPNFFYW
uniref:Uncharacterized protein n=1 Tax=Rhizophora mucronata TaxID=61149 RepID=A0A2P2QYN9_RHIMU